MRFIKLRQRIIVNNYKFQHRNDMLILKNGHLLLKIDSRPT